MGERGGKQGGDGIEIAITIPFPPSVNHYWRHTRDGRHYIAARGKEYRTEVAARVAQVPGRIGAERCSVAMFVWVPDLRRRDIDNLLKASLDALGAAGLYDDDEQIDKLSIERCGLDREHPRIDVRVNGGNDAD